MIRTLTTLLLLTPALLSGLAGCAPSTEEVVSYVKSENPVVREDWAVEAAKHNEPEVVEALIAVLNDPSDKVRLAAVASLATLKDKSSAPALVQRLKEDSNPKVREAAADALGRMEATDALPDLLIYANEFPPDDQGQLVVIWALGHVGAKLTEAEKRTPIREFLVARREQTTDKYVRFNSTTSLRALQ